MYIQQLLVSSLKALELMATCQTAVRLLPNFVLTGGIESAVAAKKVHHRYGKFGTAVLVKSVGKCIRGVCNMTQAQAPVTSSPPAGLVICVQGLGFESCSEKPQLGNTCNRYAA